MGVHERISRSPGETEALAEALGAKAHAGLVIGLSGELGAGKTCFVRGLARGLGIDSDLVHSPTFIMMTEYRGGRLPLHHVDLYRLEGHATADPALLEVLGGDGVVALEWFEHLPANTLDDRVVVRLSHRDGDERHVRFEAHGPAAERLLVGFMG